MKKIIDYFVENSIVVALLSLLILIFGITSMFSLNKETFPNVDFNYINVRTIYTGASAEDVEKLVSIEIERELKEVDGIEELNTMSAEGASITAIKVDPEFEIDEVLDEVRDALSDLASKVPDDVENPVMTKATNSTRSLLQIAIYNEDEMKLREQAKYVREKLELLKGISLVTMTGYRDEVFDIQVNLEALERNELTLFQLIDTIKDRQVNVTAGNLLSDGTDKLIRTIKELDSVKNIENIVLRSNDIGNAILIKDVAKVYRTLKEPQRIERSNQKQSIILNVQSKSSADVLDTAKIVKDAIENIKKNEGIDYKINSDLSFYVDRRLGVLSQNGMQGTFLVIICLMLFMNFRVSIITALGAPFAFLVAFSLMDGLGITINLISMFGLILVLGLLVDDSIIVAEQFYQYIEKGLKPKEAAKRAAYDTVGPVTSTVLTTMVAFGSLFYMGGIMGKFLWPVPAVVIICLLASWLECFIILPGHLADFGGRAKDTEKTRWYKPIQDFYEKTLRLALTWKFVTFGLFLAMLIGSAFMVTKMRFELFPADDVTYVYLNIKGPVGTPLEKTDQALVSVEKIVADNLKEDEFISLRAISGFQWSKGGTPRLGSHYGTVFIELSMQDLRRRKTDVILNSLSEKIKANLKGFTFSLEKIKGGPPSGKPVNIELTSESLDDLIGASKEVKKELSAMKEIISAEIDYEVGKRQILVDINELEARRLGLTNQQIAIELRGAFEGIVGATIKQSEQDIDVLIRLNEDHRRDFQTLNKIKILNNSGQRIFLNKVATFKEVDGAFIIRRLNRKRAFAISGEIDRIKTTSVEVNKTVKPLVEKIVGKYKGMDFLLTGENKETQDSLNSFKKALIASLFIILMLLVVQFSSLAQPIIIMSAIPFGFIGVVIAFLIFGLPIGFMALMGMLGLVGVVINDSIVLVSFINTYIKEHGASLDSVVKASLSRFRPVILTTFTTVAGLLPVAHMPGGDPFLKPMATSFAYGLLFATTITLILVPSCYLIYLRFSLGKESLNLNKEKTLG